MDLKSECFQLVVLYKVRRQCRWHCWGELQHLLPSPNALVAISMGMRAVKLHQQNPPVLNWRCQLTQVDLYNGPKNGGGCYSAPNRRACLCLCVCLSVIISSELHVRSSPNFLCTCFTFLAPALLGSPGQRAVKRVCSVPVAVAWSSSGGVVMLRIFGWRHICT